tara:strand:- start:465 stop:725 length:261 start_codon:yes stop_codon:yes gene_type:complete
MFISKGHHSMTTTIVKHSYYRIEIDTKDAVQPIVYFRKEGKCKTAKGMERQHNRIVNEVIEEWRQFSEQIARYTISRVPASEYVAA